VNKPLTWIGIVGLAALAVVTRDQPQRKTPPIAGSGRRSDELQSAIVWFLFVDRVRRIF
jgi:hypothetical protein